MEVKIRKVDPAVLSVLDNYAKNQGISREEYLRRLLYLASLNSSQAHLLHKQNELIQQLEQQLEKNNQLINLYLGENIEK